MRGKFNKFVHATGSRISHFLVSGFIPWLSRVSYFQKKVCEGLCFVSRQRNGAPTLKGVTALNSFCSIFLLAVFAPFRAGATNSLFQLLLSVYHTSSGHSRANKILQRQKQISRKCFFL